MSIHDVPSAVAAITAAEASRTARGRLTAEWPGLDEATAYDVQHGLLDARLVAGERLIGFKLGPTVGEGAVTGWLTDAHRLDPTEPVVVAGYIHPRIAPAIVLVLRDELYGPDCTREDVIVATAEVRAGFEVTDSRYRDSSRTLPDLVADNASAAGFHLGAMAVDPTGTGLPAEPLTLLVDGEVVATADQGDPFAAVAGGVNAVAAHGRSVPARSIVLAGPLTDAVPLAPGATYTAHFATLGELTVTAG